MTAIAETLPLNTPSAALQGMALLVRLLGLRAEAAQLAHLVQARSDEVIRPAHLVRLAKTIGLKAKVVRYTSQDLARLPLPALAVLPDDHYVLFLKIDGERLLVQDPLVRAPAVWTLAEAQSRWTGELLLCMTRPPVAERAFGFGWFLQALWSYRFLLSEAVVGSFFLQILALVSPLFFQVVIDKVLVHNSLTTLDVLCLGLLLVSVFEVLLGGFRTYLLSHTTNRIDVQLGTRLFKHLLQLPLPYFQVRRVGDSVARVRELEHIRQFLTGSGLTLLIDLFFTLVFVGVMAYYSTTLLWVVLASIPAYIAVQLLFTPLIRHRLNEKFSLGSANQAFLVESLTGIETIKSLAIEPQMQRKWEDQLAAYVLSAFKTGQLHNWASQLAGLINKIVTLLLLWLGAKAVLSAELTVGGLIAFNMLAGRVSGPILRVVQLWQDFQQIGISVQRLGDILNTKPEPAYQPHKTLPPSLTGQVKFEKVTFRYQPNLAPVLNQFDLELKPNEIIALVGASGSGKSTVGKLLQRLYLPESGRILIDGYDISALDPAWLRRQMGVVLQQSFLFNQSIRDNIAQTDLGLPLPVIIEAATLAGAHGFISQMPEGYDTLIQEQGASLSGGQRQRIAIARALVSNPRILIFDEATSALDTESEEVILQNLKNIAQGRTVLMIAHREKVLMRADRVVRL